MIEKSKEHIALVEALKNIRVTVDDVGVSALNSLTDKIVINCFAGAIVDIKPQLRIKIK